MRAIRVFISHSHEDMEMATRLSDTLGQLDVVPFIAHSDIMGGELWKETIRDEIVECDVLVALLTTNFRKSEFTEQEVGAAWVLKKPVLPLYTGDGMPSGFIADRQYVKYDNSNPERAAGEILKFVLFKTYGRERAVGMMVDMLTKAKSETECDALVTAIISEKEMAPKQAKRVINALQSNSHATNSLVNEIMRRELRETSRDS